MRDNNYCLFRGNEYQYFSYLVSRICNASDIWRADNNISQSILNLQCTDLVHFLKNAYYSSADKKQQ